MWKALLAAAVGLVCLAIIAVSYIVPNIRVKKQSTSEGDRVRVETPFGSVRVDAHKDMQADTGDIPIYPGASRTKNNSGGATVDLDWGSGEKQLSLAAAEYTTTDSVSQVRRWYQDRLPNWKVSEKEMVHVEGNLKHIVSVKERDGVTRIGIVRIGEPAAN